MPKNKHHTNDTNDTDNSDDSYDSNNIRIDPGRFPKNIYVIRHGEKPNDKDIHELSIKGVARAYYMINYWTNSNNQSIVRPDIIYCFVNSYGLGNRSYQLMLPLIRHSNIPVNTNFKDDKDEKSMVLHVMSNNPGKTVLICWEHSNIPLVIGLIYDQLFVNNTMRDRYKYWALDPTNGADTKNKDDGDLYSLTILIDTSTGRLDGYSQSNNFLNNVLLLDEPIKNLFTIN